VVSELPLISCIMPTRVRRTAFVAQAIRLFQAQDYPRKELIIIDGDSEDLHKISAYGVIPSEAEIAYVYVDLAGTLSQLTIGAKRNLAVSLAHGEIIAHWDDDDYYAPDRLSRQVAPLLAGEADISGLAMDGVLDLNEMAAWRCGPTLHNEIFALGVHGGTLLYRKSLWGQTAAFQNSSSGEDGAFLRLVLSQGARLARVANNGSFVYMRHESRWPLPPNPYPSMRQWRQVAPQELLPPDALACYVRVQQEMQAAPTISDGEVGVRGRGTEDGTYSLFSAGADGACARKTAALFPQ